MSRSHQTLETGPVVHIVEDDEDVIIYVDATPERPYSSITLSFREAAWVSETMGAIARSG